MNLWNPNTPIAELPHLTDKLKRSLDTDGYKSVDKLDKCPKAQLRALEYSVTSIGHIHEALRQQRRFAEEIADLLTAEGITLKMLISLQPFDLLNLPLSTAQVGYLLRWQRDIGGRYSDKEIFCVANGRVYYCTDCPYRDERSNYCGWCTRKLLDDLAEKKGGRKDAP